MEFALILAGGEGHRIGGKKYLKKLFNKPLLFWALKPYLELKLPIIISVKDLEQKKEIEDLIEKEKIKEIFKIIEDLPNYQGKGPLAGLFSVMQSLSKNFCLIVSAVDQPFIKRELIQELISQKDLPFSTLVFKKDSSLEPFPGLYKEALLPELKKFLTLSSKKKFKSFLESLCSKKSLGILEDWIKIDPKGESFININTWEELYHIERRFSFVLP